jgi:1,4-dihydroxy-2-naphthoate octaprenyltransferase
VRAWLVAARPATLLASVAPVLVGSGLAVGDGAFRWDAFVVTVVTAVLINVSANFANDASDHARGVDTADRIGPPRAVAGGLLSARQVWLGTVAVVALACAGGAYLAWISDWQILAVGVAALLAMLAYSGGPWPYGYHGLGEVSVFAFFGLAGVVGSRFVHDSTAPASAWLLAVPVGFLVTAILVANNVRDIDTDRSSGKRTLAVVLGRPATRVLYATLVLGSFALIAAFAAFDLTPRLTLIALTALPLAVAPVRAVATQTAGPQLITALKANTRVHLAVGVLLAAGAALGRPG